MSRSNLILFACMLLTFILGSVHAFSVLIVPLEELLQVPRSDVSLIYSLALVAITLSVLFGYLIFERFPAWTIVLMVCLLAASGLMLAAQATNRWLLLLGYSVLFGGANGIGYGFTLQLSALEMPQRKGFAMGMVTASYAVGSIVFARLIAAWIESSVASAFWFLAFALLLCGLVSTSILYVTRARYQCSRDEIARNLAQTGHRRIGVYWLAYLSSVFAGLMAIGHAAGIALSRGASQEMAIWCAMLIGIGSATGGFFAGWSVDRWRMSGFLIGLPLLSALLLLLLAFGVSPVLGIVLLGFVGFCYGAIIAVYPVAIANEFGDLGPRVYGRIFTAWGFAGLLAPWSAGLIYDDQGNYQMAMIVASMFAMISAMTVIFGGLKGTTKLFDDSLK